MVVTKTMLGIGKILILQYPYKLAVDPTVVLQIQLMREMGL